VWMPGIACRCLTTITRCQRPAAAQAAPRAASCMFVPLHRMAMMILVIGAHAPTDAAGQAQADEIRKRAVAAQARAAHRSKSPCETLLAPALRYSHDPEGREAVEPQVRSGSSFAAGVLTPHACESRTHILPNRSICNAVLKHI
jgi:hypothetical protein